MKVYESYTNSLNKIIVNFKYPHKLGFGNGYDNIVIDQEAFFY